MKDLDFDELDRAVNSLMANVPKAAPQTDEAKEKTLSIDSTLDGDTPPPFSKVEETAAKAADESNAVPASVSVSDPVVATPPKSAPAAHAAVVHARPQSATPANRRSGRFMDVVHPSADMKKPDAPKPVSRQGATIEPLSSSGQKIADIVPSKKPKPVDEKPVGSLLADEKPAAPSKDETSTPAPAAETPAMPVLAGESAKIGESTFASDWPDPLDMAKPAGTPQSETKDGSEVLAEPKTESPEEPAPAPLTSPFLPDTKVEKRPLGGLTPEEESSVEELSRPPVAPVDDTPKTVDDPNAQLPADPNTVEAQLPEELSGDLMAVEADTTHDEIKQAHDSTLGNATPAQHEDKGTPKEAVFEEPEAAKEPSTPVGPTSIPQQYREEPSTGDKDNGAIYDTDAYHQPLAHPAKKKSGWMWVIWIVVILLLGAGGGAALYFLGLV